MWSMAPFTTRDWPWRGSSAAPGARRSRASPADALDTARRAVYEKIFRNRRGALKMSSEEAPHVATAWQNVAEELLALLRMLETAQGRPTNMLKFAEGFAALSRAYLAAIGDEGRSSMRV